MLRFEAMVKPDCITIRMISSVLPAATASGLMRANVRSVGNRGVNSTGMMAGFAGTKGQGWDNSLAPALPQDMALQGRCTVFEASSEPAEQA